MLKEIPNTWFDEQQITIQLYKSKVPEKMHDGIIRYVVFGTRPGSFLRAVISNDLRASIHCGDKENLKMLHTFVHYFYQYAYPELFGSPEKMKHWMEIGGLHGLQRQVLEQVKKEDEEDEREKEKDV